MTKWEYMYVQVIDNNIQFINEQIVGEYKGFFEGFAGRPQISKFLEKSGQEGWEVVGICPASEVAGRWRLILKRPISE
jgi:hypothetical protein